MPSLIEAYKLSSRAAQVGFDWPDMGSLLEKLREETEELQQHFENFRRRDQGHNRGASRERAGEIPEISG